MSDESDIDADLIAQYRASARGAPDAALDLSILRAAQAASWRRRNAWVFASAAVAACAVLAVTSIERTPVMPFEMKAQTVENQLRQARTRAFLLDAQAMRDSAWPLQPGATTRSGDSNHP